MADVVVADSVTVPLLPKGELDKFAIANRTDKSSLQHDYMRFYEFLLTPYRKKKFTLMELGIGIPSREAPSLRAWKRFFPKAQIVGVDIRGVSKKFEAPRIAIEIGDASKPRFLNRIFREWRPSIIIDDASHFWSHQIIGFQTMFPQLPPHGIYIVEDIQTSFLREEKVEGSAYADHHESFWTYISRLQAALACGQGNGPELTAHEAAIVSEIDAIFLCRETVAIIKREAPREQEATIARKKRRREKAIRIKEAAEKAQDAVE